MVTIDDALAVRTGLKAGSEWLAVRGYRRADGGGFATIPVTIVMFALSRRFGALADRFGPRLFMGGGPLVAAAGILLLVRLDAHVSYVTDLLPAMLLFALGLSMTVAPLTATVLADADEADAGIASATNNAVARVAGLLGISVAGVYSPKDGSFTFKPGPIFTNILLADEINRASPRTQSALLQAMQEHHVTVAGARHDLPAPFHVLATQNPLEQEGTYPLPEAQLDRFLMEIDVDYPDREAERKILFDTTGAEESKAKAAMTAEDLMAAQRLVRRLPVGESVVESILALVRSARPGPEGGELAKSIAWGPGPRASQALMLAVRARALLDGRYAPSVDDVVELAEPVLKHRMALTFAARADGETIPAIIGKLKSRIG
jgi:MoxR-like ATPase